MSLLFRVLVIASGYRAVVTEHVDPGAEMLSLELEPLVVDLPADRVLQGRVVDESGRPVSGALVTPVQAETTERRWYGSMPGVDSASVTDEEGEFTMTSTDPKLALGVEIEAPGFAIRSTGLLALNGDRHEIELQRGGTVVGTLSWNGEYVADRTVGIVQLDRGAGQFVGEVTLATDQDGQFLFPNLQANEAYVLYTLCSGEDEPVLKTHRLETGESDSIVNVGDLELTAGLIFGGRVELPEGAELPADSKIRISRDPAWDWCERPLERDGRFVVRGLPPEVLTIRVVVPGFKIDTGQLRFQSVGRDQFALRLRENREDVVIPLRADESN